jgi:phosphoribosylformylglycinamidine cyclo-ligase
MYRVFNCGIGMVAVFAPGDVDRASTLLRSAGETVYRIGAIEPRPAGGAATVVR